MKQLIYGSTYSYTQFLNLLACIILSGWRKVVVHTISSEQKYSPLIVAQANKL